MTALYGSSEGIGKFGSFVKDYGSGRKAVADRELGFMAAWWVSNSNAKPDQTFLYLALVIQKIAAGDDVP